MIDSIILAIPYFLLFLVFGIFGIVLSGLLSIAYFTFFEGSQRGQTIGKAALDIRVVSLSTGQPIGHGAAFGRQVVRIVSGLVFDLGYLWMLWDRERQTWHDKAVDSIVIPAR